VHVTFSKILLGTDFSPASEAAQSYALAIAGRYRSELYIAHVIGRDTLDLVGQDRDALLLQAREQAQKKLSGLSNDDHYRTIVAEGDVAEVLVEIIRTNQIQLAVVGTHGRRAFEKMMLGSVAEKVFRRATCPVLTVRPDHPSTSRDASLRNVLYALEFAPDSSGAAPYAVSLAERYGATLTLMNVRDDMAPAPNVEEAFNEPVRRWIDERIPPTSGLRNRVRFVRGFGSVVEAILSFATDAAVDLIVMPINALDPIIAAHLPRPDSAYEVVRSAPCPVLTVR
jgi:nucleotide-binding universal stress UspA family protein